MTSYWHPFADMGVVEVSGELPIVRGEGAYVFDADGRRYFDATAGLAPDADLERLMAVFSERSVARLGVPWPVTKVTGEAPHRLYVATVREAFVLDQGDRRTAVSLG